MEQTLGQKFIIYTLTGSAGLLTLVFAGKELSKSLKKEKAKGLKLSTDKNVRWASRLYAALYDSHFNENEEGVYEVATEMCGKTDFENVAKAYKGAFDKDLFKDLTRLLSSREYSIFLQKLDIC